MEEEKIAEEISSQEEVSQQQNQKEVAQEQTRSNVDHNWEQANQVLRLQKQRIEELEAWKSQYEQASRQAPKQEEQDEFATLDPEDYMTVGKAKELSEKLVAKQAAKTAKEVVQEYIQQQNLVHDEQRMRSLHDDFDHIVENYAIPKIKNNRALALEIQNSPNPAETAYEIGKLMAMKDKNKNQEPSPKAEKIIKNSNRPVSSTAVGNTLKAQADDFSKMSSQQIWEISQKYARGA